MKITHYRDLTLLHLNNKEILITACDSCGGVGEKPCDELNVPAEVVGALTTRVVLLEIMCSGAEVVCLYDVLSCEMQPTGKKIIEGVKGEVLRAGLDVDIISGSTEDNFSTAMTGIGIVAQGICKKPRFGNVQKGDLLLLLGIPKYKSQINIPLDDDLVSYEEVRKLTANSNLGEIVPCGSKGPLYEAKEIAKHNNLSFKQTTESPYLTASAGPATCLVVTLSPKYLNTLGNLSLQITQMGVFE